MPNETRVLLLDCDETFRESLALDLAGQGLEVLTAANGADVMSKVHGERGEFQVLVIGEIQDPASEIEIMVQLRHQYERIEAIMLTNPGQARRGIHAIEHGAFAYLEKPVSLQALAMQIACAARFADERQHSSALQALVTAAQRVGLFEDEKELYEQLYEEARRLLPGMDTFLITQYDIEENEVSFPYARREGELVTIPPRRRGNSIAEYVFRTQEPLLLPLGDKLFREEHLLDPPDIHLGYSVSEIVAPMFLEGGICGSIFVTTHKEDVHYTPEHLHILQNFANQVPITLRNVKQLKEARELQAATAALAGHHGQEAVIRSIVEEAHKLIDSDFTGLILQDPDGTLRKVRPVIPDQFFDRFGDPRQQGGLTRLVVERREPVNIEDTSAHELVKKSVQDAGIRSMLALPLVHGDRVLGVLYAHTNTRRSFGNRRIQLWNAFATQAAAALDRVLEEERQIRDYKQLVRELSKLEDPADLQDTIRRVASAAKAVFNSDTCRLFYVDPPTARIIGSAWADSDEVRFHVESQPRPDGLTRHVLHTKSAYFYPDAAANGPRPRDELFSLGLQAVASLPLIYGGRMIAVLHCNYFTRQPVFHEHYKTLMEAFGGRAAVALHKARRDHISGVWRGLDWAILTRSELRELYRLFAERAHTALGADFSIFYPYNPSLGDAEGTSLPEEQVVVGKLRMPWQPPAGGLGGSVHKGISTITEALIVNDLEAEGGKYSSNLAVREGIKAFVAIRLEVRLPGMAEPRLAGILFLNYRRPVSVEHADLVELRYASELIAAKIALQNAFEQRNLQLRAVIDIFRDIESESPGLNLDHIAERAGQSLGIDTCTIMEFDPKSKKFTGRGNFGLQHPEFGNGNPRPEFAKYMGRHGPAVIPDVQKDDLMSTSLFVQREGIVSTIVYPLWAEGSVFGLLFANYRRKADPSAEHLESIGLFADVAAHVLHGATLKSALNETQMKLERRLFLVWVSMLEDMWRHSILQKATSIRNYSLELKKRMKYESQTPPLLGSLPKIVDEIDRLAADITNAPPRVPHVGDMQAELVPLAALLQEIAQRENQSFLLQASSQNSIAVQVAELGGAQVRGYRRWLIFMFETLLQNSYKAMPHGGQILITATKHKDWAEIRIKDTGTGVPFRLRNKIFKEVITGKRDRPGLGIGSMLAATLAEENQGAIELERPGPGDTTVLIRLPIAREAARR